MLILVRHGRTAVNAQGRLQGRMDPPLDAVGEDQARRIGWALPDVDRVISSPLQRASATAARLGRPVEVDERWVELDYGELDGRPVADVTAAEWRRWRTDNAYAPPGGESLEALMARLRPALDEAADRARTETVVVVTHVSPIKAAVAWALGVGVEISWRFHLDQASITRIVIGPGGPSLKTLNETGHLATDLPHALP